ncbi:Uncharacterized protein APZ42_029711 [Daphnia magna]|uniref:Uncharacterized protein n=1 Tax=Daphnia magna TaxID=35525 RepID=A0A164PDW2_9CRUS|nr:Uncharacterized protein APZ42_029711 [Daphnia magna]
MAEFMCERGKASLAKKPCSNRLGVLKVSLYIAELMAELFIYVEFGRRNKFIRFSPIVAADE